MIVDNESHESWKTECLNKIKYQGIILRHISFIGYEGETKANTTPHEYPTPKRQLVGGFNNATIVFEAKKILLRLRVIVKLYFYSFSTH
jgi:hypothetical protein